MRAHGGRWAAPSAVATALTAAFVGVATPAPGALRTTLGAPPGSPALDFMALAVADLPAGAAVRRQGYVKDSSFSVYYVREFRPGASLGTSRLTGLESDVGLTGSSAAAARLASAVEATLRSKEGRRAFANAALEDAGWDRKGLRITFGGVHKLTAGDAAFIAPMTLSLPGRRRFSVVLELTRVERVVQVLYLMGSVNTTIVPAEAVRLAGVVAERMRAGLIPAGIEPPTVVGTAEEGQTLAAEPGAWTNAPTSFATQWLRCDPTAANCASIDGATAATYVLDASDLGSTIEVSVVATNAAGASQPVRSTSTVPVLPAMPTPAARAGVSR